MARSSGSLETSANSNPTTTTTITTMTTASSFSFPNQFMFTNNTSFADLLGSDNDYSVATKSSNGRGLGDRITDRIGSGVPKFKSLPPPSLPMISSPCVSPSSYFAIPPGLSPTELLDSPVLLSSSYLISSPTTGSFPFQALNWKSNSNITQNQQDIKEEKEIEKEKENYSDFSFHTQTRPTTSSYDSRAQSNLVSQGSQAWNCQEPVKLEAENDLNNQNNGGFQSDYTHCDQSSRTITVSKKSEDGYSWRKYGQKQVKGSENPRSYYKCTFPNCPTKKKVEIRSSDGQITEIVYKGTHNHPKPQSTRRSTPLSLASSLAIPSYNAQANEVPERMDSLTMPENSCISIGDDDFEQSSQNNRSVGDDGNEDEPDAKRWKTEGDSEGISVLGNRTVREPRVVVQTRSDIDILDDGYRWRKYGQKVVKGNPNPRSYYKCTTPGCPVRKHVERAGHDIRSVITTYEGKHNHDVPAARGSGGGSHSLNRPIPTSNANNNNNNNNNNATMEIRPHTNYQVPLRSQAPYTLEMFQNPGSFDYTNQPHDNMFFRAKEEPRDDMFFESFLC